MCGIAGAIGFVDQRVADAARRMRDAMVHRGPDGEGVWQHFTDERARLGVVLVHRRLAIVDLTDAGAQPMRDEGTGNVICYNGEVYNFVELRESLGDSRPLASGTDTEVVLRSFATDGIDCIDRFRGMFAFALWDEGKQQLHLVRDRLGIKPLYYATVRHAGGQRTTLFASELRALLASGLIERRLSERGLASYLWNGFVCGPDTIVAGCHELPAGCRAVLSPGAAHDKGDIEPIRYWQPPGHAIDGDASSHFEAELSDAVRIRLRSDVPLGLFLSGGIDSSTVATLASRNRDHTVRTFNIGFDDAALDESPYAEAIARQLGTEHHCLKLTESRFQSMLPQALGALDQPSFDALNTYAVSRLVKEAGITVALSGTGGDELFGGYPSFQKLGRLRKLSRIAGLLPTGLIERAGRGVTALKYGRRGSRLAQSPIGKLGDALARGRTMAAAYQMAYCRFTQTFLADSCACDAGDGMTMGLDADYFAYLEGLTARSPDLHAISQLELCQFLGQRLLRDMDSMSMAVSLELRVPLIDHLFITRVCGLDLHRRFDPLGEKRLLRDGVLKAIDPATFDRPKQGFTLPLAQWSRRGLSPRMTAWLGDRERCRSVGLNGEAIAALWSAYAGGHAGIHWSRPWSIFVLMHWCDEHGVGLR